MSYIEPYKAHEVEFDTVEYTDFEEPKTYQEEKLIKWKRLGIVCAIANTMIIAFILGVACVMCFRESSVLSFFGGIRFSWMVAFSVSYIAFVMWTLFLMLDRDKKLN